MGSQRCLHPAFTTSRHRTRMPSVRTPTVLHAHRPLASTYFSSTTSHSFRSFRLLSPHILARIPDASAITSARAPLLLKHANLQQGGKRQQLPLCTCRFTLRFAGLSPLLAALCKLAADGNSSAAGRGRRRGSCARSRRRSRVGWCASSGCGGALGNGRVGVCVWVR